MTHHTGTMQRKYPKKKTDIRWSYQVEILKEINAQTNRQLRREGIGAYPAQIWFDFDKNLNYNLF